MKRLTTISIALLAGSLFFAGCDNKKKDAAAADPATKAAPTPTEPAPTPAVEAPTTPPADPAAAGAVAPTDPAAPGAAAVPTGPVPSDAEITATVEKSLGIIEGFAAAAKGAKGDCNVMAESMQKVVDANKETLTKIKSFGQNPEVGKKAQELMQKNMGRWTTSMQAMSEATTACQSDPKVQKVFEQLQM
jgi:hypothetical protein